MSIISESKRYLITSYLSPSIVVDDLLGGGITERECERNERMKWCHEVDTHEVSE